MSETYQQQLDRVQAAIAALETGRLKRYRIGDQEFEHADLEVLYKREQRLLNRVNEGGRMRIRGAEF
jgi:hypothetical protein